MNRVKHKTGLLKIFISVCIFCIACSTQPDEGRFYMVSAGIGDPDMITIRGLETIKKSDIIICRPETAEIFKEHLKGKTLWDGAFNEWRTYGRDCSEIKDEAAGDRCKSDRKVINNLDADIRSAVNDGKTVSVIGGGDLTIYPGPFRWYMEEMSDIIHEMIPGVSAFNAANANLRRDLTGGPDSNSAVLTDYQDIDKVAGSNPTLVIFTMGATFEEIVDKLKVYYPDDTPVAIVFYAGFREKEYRISGRLDNIIEKTEDIDFPFEHLVYVGDFLK